MHCSGRTFLSTLTITALQPFSLASRIPSRTAEHRQLYDGPTQVTLPDLGDLAKFVCPKRSTNIFHRQSAGLSQVSTEQIRDILDMLHAYEESTLTLINGILIADGIDPASAAPSLLTIATPSLESFRPVATAFPSLSPQVNSAAVAPPPQRPKGVACIPVTTTIIERITETQTQTVTVSAACASAPATTTLAAESGAATTLQAAATTLEAAATSDLPSQPTYPAYTFNAASTSNVAVYFGQTPATGATSLEAQCADPNTDILILAFVVEQLDGGAYPQINFGAACGGQTPLMTQKAPGLLSCPELAGNISVCQSGWGKKVMLSIGGSTSNIKFASTGAATRFAGVLWDLFGPAGNVDPDLRPFGDVEVDGFDIDNEDNFPTHWQNIATGFRNLYPSATKQYYLSSSPQCLFPFADPMPLLIQCDFVWVQFFNSPACQLGAAGFNTSIVSWAHNLNNSTLIPKPKLYIGAPAWRGAASAAYNAVKTANGMERILRGVREVLSAKGVENMLGGAMFWDGPEGHLNVEGGKDIIAWGKEGLTS